MDAMALVEGIQKVLLAEFFRNYRNSWAVVVWLVALLVFWSEGGFTYKPVARVFVMEYLACPIHVHRPVLTEHKRTLRCITITAFL